MTKPKAIRFVFYGLATLLGLVVVLGAAGLGDLLVGSSSARRFSTPVPVHPGEFIRAEVSGRGRQVERAALVVEWVQPGGWVEATQSRLMTHVSGPFAPPPVVADPAAACRWYGTDALVLRVGSYPAVGVVVAAHKHCVGDFPLGWRPTRPRRADWRRDAARRSPP